MRPVHIRILLLTLSLAYPLLATAQNTTPPKAEEDFTQVEDEVRVSDPLEPMNRAIYAFNDKAYYWVMKPVARGYRAVVPEGGRSAVSNFFSNLVTPIRMVNAGLQLKGEDMGNEATRFLINTTLGLGGLFDVAKTDFRIEKKEEDFGQTLGHYGVGSGPYLVLPILGPSNLRDGFGLLVDGVYLDPAAYLDDSSDYLAVKFVIIETELSLDKDTYEAMQENSLDPYLFLRNSYYQYREGKIAK